MVKQESHQHNKLPARVYRYRVLGMALGGLAIAAVLFENKVSMAYWAWWFFSCFLWPHVAFYTAKHQSNPYHAERNNLLFDSFIAGTWAALMWFNLLPAVLLLVMTTSDKVNSGIRNLWIYSQPFMLLGILLGFTLTGFEFKPETSMTVILASLPIMTVHIAFVSLGSYKLVRKVQLQNIQFRALSQKDTLTQLFNRRHWQNQVSQLLDRTSDSEISLILIDVDNFKQINDKFGHLAGDDVLSGIADIITNLQPQHAIAGRLGGDEFAIVIQDNIQTARNLASQICQNVSELKIQQNKELKCTVSIGLSAKEHFNGDFRSWFDQADRSLYHAKKSGRNQVQ